VVVATVVMGAGVGGGGAGVGAGVGAGGGGAGGDDPSDLSLGGFRDLSMHEPPSKQYLNWLSVKSPTSGAIAIISFAKAACNTSGSIAAMPAANFTASIDGGSVCTIEKVANTVQACSICKRAN
jgi:hypothetical protein